MRKAAQIVRQCEARVFQLALGGPALKLQVALIHHPQTGSADGMAEALQTTINLARHLDIDPGNALRRCNRKFRTRFAHIEDNITDYGETMQSADLDLMEQLWSEAKSAAKK